jgi:hypothetical protein
VGFAETLMSVLGQVAPEKRAQGLFLAFAAGSVWQGKPSQEGLARPGDNSLARFPYHLEDLARELLFLGESLADDAADVVPLVVEGDEAGVLGEGDGGEGLVKPHDWSIIMEEYGGYPPMYPSSYSPSLASLNVFQVPPNATNSLYVDGVPIDST